MLREKVLYYSNEEKEQIEKEIIPDQKLLEDKIIELEKWLEKQPHLPKNESKNWLTNMLILNKFNVEKTKQKLDSLYTSRSLLPIFFENRDPFNPAIQNIMKAVMICPLPKLNTDLCRVYVFKFLSEPDIFDTESYAKYVFLTIDIRCGFESDRSISDHYIVDYGDAKLGHILKTNPILLKKGHDVIKNCYAERIKAFHFINIPDFAQTSISILLNLLSAKLKSRLFFHKNNESLHTAISKKILPIEYGGEEKSIKEINANWIQYLESASDWFKNEELRKSDESLRPVWAPLNPNLYGTEGSFRKLEVD